jgi:S1-C subfamily serine protease
LHKKYPKSAAFLFCCIMAATLSSCSHVKHADYLPPQAQPADATPAPVGWSGIEMKLPTGDDVGTVGSGDGFCPWPYQPVTRNDIRKSIDHEDIKDIFRDSLKSQGYDVTGTVNFDFPDDFEGEEQRSEYKIGAKITQAQIYACYSTPNVLEWILGGRYGYDGEFYVGIDWFLYDALRRKVVYKTHSEGYSKRRNPSQEGITLLFDDAFEMAAHNLGTDKGLHDILFFGAKPENDGLKKDNNHPERRRQFDPDEEVVLSNPPLLTSPFVAHAEHDRHVAVMIEGGDSEGSGFFITQQGHILTNAHVVGDALLLRVVTADKKDKLIAEVLRKDKARDIALIRLQEIPKGMKIVTLPIRTGWPKVGEPVYDIGSPLDKRSQDTVRGGIVSALRKDFRIMGARQTFIQSDVASQPGNSGGPLLDGNGNIVGLADMGLMSQDDNDFSLNYFIPIGEALDALDIRLEGRKNKGGGKP